MRKIYDFFKNNRKPITISKFVIMSILMLFSLKWAIFCEVLLAVAIVFTLTEFEFDGFYIPFFLVNFRFIFRHNLVGKIPYVEIVFCVFAIFAIVKYLIIKKEKLKINWWVIGFSTAYILWVLISLKIFGFNITEFAAQALMIAMINFIFLFKNKIDFRKLIISFASGVISAGIIEWISQYIFAGKFITMDMAVADAHGNSRHRGLAGDPNYYSIDLLIAMAGLYFLNIKNKVNKTFYYIAMCILVVFVYFTYSKSAILGFGVFIVLATVFSLIAKPKIWKKLLLFLGVIIFALVILKLAFQVDPFITFKRFTETYVQPDSAEAAGALDNITTGRWTLWKNHLKFNFSSVKNFFIGGGLGTHVEPMEAHNTYIQIFYETGFIGLAILFGLFISVCFGIGLNKSNFKPKNWINFLIFLTGAFMLANVNYLAVTSFVYHLTLMFCVISYKNDDKNKQETTFKQKKKVA